MIEKYKMKKVFRIIQLLLLAFGFALSIMRWIYSFNNNIVVINHEITSHISNFALSLMAYLVIGSTWLTYGVKFNFVAGLGVFMIIANFICETLLSSINTVDIVDAIYGTIGVVIAFVFIVFAHINGLIKINTDS